MAKKAGGFIIVAMFIGLIVGFVALLRGCLSQFDEHKVQSLVESFSISGHDIIVYIKSDFIVNSYSSDGGSTEISGSTRYYLETRDAVTLQLIAKTRLKKPKDATSYIPSIIGRNDKQLWLFWGSIVAYDPLTHTIVCTADTLCTKNLQLKNNLPNESEYYEYNYAADKLVITTRDAYKYSIDKEFEAKPVVAVKPFENPVDVTHLENLTKQYKKILFDLSRRNESYLLFDSIKMLQENITRKVDSLAQLEKLHSRRPRDAKFFFRSMHDILVNAVSFDSVIVALLPDETPLEQSAKFHFNRVSLNDTRKVLYRAPFTRLENGDINHYEYTSADVGSWQPFITEKSFLNSGFLLNAETIQPLQYGEPKSFFICSTSEVGKKSTLILTRISETESIIWTTVLPFCAFNEMSVCNNNLILAVSASNRIDGKNGSDLFVRIALGTGDAVMREVKAQ